jgi:hypothetical protein
VELEILARLSRVEQTQWQGVRVALWQFFGEEQKVLKLVRRGCSGVGVFLVRIGTTFRGQLDPAKLPGVTQLDPLLT